MDSQRSPANCFICLNSIDVTRRPTSSSQILKQNSTSFSTLGKVFHISKVFIDPFLSSSRGGERPLQCSECSTSLTELSDVQSTLGGLSEEVLQLQNQLMVKLKQLAKVVGVTQRNKKNIHQNLIKTERQLQNSMRGGGFGGLVSPELYSLRQLILGALMLSGTDDHVPEVPKDCSSSTSFPNNFAVQDSSKKDGLGGGGRNVEPEFNKCSVKEEPGQNGRQTDNNFDLETEDTDVWNGYILLNEDEPAQPDDNDFIYAEDNDHEEEEVVISEDGGSDYTPCPKRKKVERLARRKQGRKPRRRDDDDDSCSDSDVDDFTREADKLKKSGNIGGGRSITKTLRRLETKLCDHDTTLRKLLGNKAFMSQMRGEVESEVKELLASLKCEDSSGTVETQKFNGLVDQVEKCFTNHSVLRKEMVEMKSSFQGSLQEAVVNNSVNSYQVKWPIRTESDIKVIEKQLEDPAVYQAEVQALARVGGNSKSKIVYNTLRAIVTHDCAMRIRFTNKTGKIAFGELRMASLVRDAIKMGNPTKNFTDDHINEMVGCWFRQSIDRSKSTGRGSKIQNKSLLSKRKSSSKNDEVENDELLDSNL